MHYLLPKTFGLSHRLTWSVPDEGYPTNGSCALTSTYLAGMNAIILFLLEIELYVLLIQLSFFISGKRLEINLYKDSLSFSDNNIFYKDSVTIYSTTNVNIYHNIVSSKYLHKSNLSTHLLNCRVRNKIRSRSQQLLLHQNVLLQYIQKLPGRYHLIDVTFVYFQAPLSCTINTLNRTKWIFPQEEH